MPTLKPSRPTLPFDDIRLSHAVAWALLAGAFAIPLPAAAGDDAAAGSWQFEATPYLWATGLDGTLRRSRAMAGRAHLKTGSLRDVAGIAGYVLGASGRRYVLVALINHPNANAARPALDALVQWTMNDLNPRVGTPRP